jgi:hypothetical protein
MLPAAFSKLFKGEPNPAVQRICKDVKLFDVIARAGRRVCRC